jgi:hypothetical protein
MNLDIIYYIKNICYIGEADKYNDLMEKEAKLFVKYFKNYKLK